MRGVAVEKPEEITGAAVVTTLSPETTPESEETTGDAVPVEKTVSPPEITPLTPAETGVTD